VDTKDVGCGGGEKLLSWKQALAKAGLSQSQGVAIAGTKVLLWHWLQPAYYYVALNIYWGDLRPGSRSVGWWVGVREGLYVLVTVLGLFANPAYLLVDLRATVWGTDDGRLRDALIYIFCPEKFVANCVLNATDGALKVTATVCVAAFVLLDAVAVLAFFAALLPAEPFPPPLLVGYAVTTIAGVGFFALTCNNNKLKACQERFFTVKSEVPERPATTEKELV